MANVNLRNQFETTEQTDLNVNDQRPLLEISEASPFTPHDDCSELEL